MLYKLLFERAAFVPMIQSVADKQLLIGEHPSATLKLDAIREIIVEQALAHMQVKAS